MKNTVDKKSTPHRRKPLLIIGAGKMGRWFASYFNHRYEIYMSDNRKIQADSLQSTVKAKLIEDYMPMIRNFPIVIIAVNLESAAEVIDNIKAEGYNGTLVDISTLKTPVNTSLKTLPRALSIHPLFGPGARSIRGKIIALIPLANRRKELAIARALFPGAEFIIMNEYEHDKAISYAIELPQIISMLALHVLSGRGKNTLATEGTSFKALRMLIATSLYGSERLAREIILKNNFTEELLARLSEALVDIKTISVEELLESTTSFKTDYEKFYKILEKKTC